MIQTNTAADVIASFLESKGLAGNGTDYPLKTGFRPEFDQVVCCIDTGARYDGDDHRRKERLKTPKVQILIRDLDYTKAALLANRIDEALSAVTVEDKFQCTLPDRTVLLAAFVVISGPLYAGRDPKPGQLENFSLNGLLTLTTVSIP